MRPRLTATAILTGVALIVLPLVGAILKLVSAGWILVIVLVSVLFPLLLLIGYALQVVVAATGFFSARGPIQSTAVQRRATIAAWTTSIAWVVACVFLVDGDDVDEGSTFQVWFGLRGDGSAADIASNASSVVFLVAALVWLLSYVWLVVEWSIGWALRRRARGAAELLRPPAPDDPEGDIADLFTRAP